MRLSPAVPWRDVMAGAIVLDHGIPRRVIDRSHFVPTGSIAFLLEGLDAPLVITDEFAREPCVQLVLLEPADAIATLAAAGLNPEVLD